MSADDPKTPSPAPSAGDGPDRRRHARASIPMLIQLRFDTFDDFTSEYSADISPGGLFVRTDEPREVGSMVYLQFALRDGSRLIEALGRVVRVIPASADQPGGMGIEFLNYDDESEQVIAKVVEARLGQEYQEDDS